MNQMSTDKAVGMARYQSDKRQLGGLLMLFSLCTVGFPLAGLTARIGPNGTTAAGPPIEASAFAGSIILVFFGCLGLINGWLVTVHDSNNYKFTGLTFLAIQMAYVPFVTDLNSVGKGIMAGSAFIPKYYNPSRADNTFVGVMGLIALFGYAIGFIGSMSFCSFALYAYQKGKPDARGGKYYRGRLAFYSLLLLLAGGSQLALGAYILSQWGGGSFDANGVIGVAVYYVTYPEIAVVVGAVQSLNAFYGFARAFGLVDVSKDNHWFQVTSLVTFFVYFILSVLVQLGLSPGAEGMAPNLFLITFGTHIFPIFLDYKMRTTPDCMPDDFYGPLFDDEEEAGKDLEKQEGGMSEEESEVEKN